MEEAGLQFLATRVVLGYYPKGTVILDTGQPRPLAFHIIQRGTVQLLPFNAAHSDDHYPVNMGPGECFSVSAMLENRPVIAPYTAVSDTFCYELPAEHFPELLDRSPVFREFTTEFLASMLHRSGLALTRADGKGTLEVLNMQGPRGRDVTSRAETLTLEQVLARPDRKMPVSTVVKLQHVNATIATNALRPFFASTGGPVSSLTLGNVGNNSGMVLCGMQDQVVQAIRMLREVDLPATPEEVARQKSNSSRVEDLEKRVKALEEKLEQLSKPAK